jgi:hypothetical protein
VRTVQRRASPGIVERVYDAQPLITAPALQVRTCILVAGMHRSGTSAATRVINLLGADIAGDLVDGIPGDNDRGFWESHATYRLHDRLFAALGSAWHYPYPLPDGWQQTDAAREARRAIREHLETQFGGSRLFVVKDPRMTRVLPLWLEVLDGLAIAPLIVIPVRNPLEVATSLERRDGLPLAQALLVYIQGNLAVEQASRGRPRIFQLYDELISDWRPFAAKLGRSGGSQANALGPAVAGEIDSFLSADLRRNRATRASLASVPAGAALVAEIYDRMVEAAASGDETLLRACFDRVREHLWETAKLFGAVASAQAKDQRAEVAGLETKMAAEVARRDAHLDALQAQLRDHQARAEEMAAELHRRNAEIRELRAQVGALDASAAEATRAQAVANEQISAMLRSTGWRVTAPLRIVGGLVKSVLRR